tara:strand:+ start:77 stop:799 length:723 start_codon:yes stop_codon:yes gene_type:complete
MNKYKQIINLFIPPLFPTVIRKFKKNLKINKDHEFKFNYEENFYNRIAFISRAINTFDLDTCKYLEIGVCTNEVFNAIGLKSANKVGVDPQRGGTHRMTSDDFFKTCKEKFDVIFIDGLHHYEQCKRDCLNSVNSLTEKGIIIFHDFLPRNFLEENIPPKQKTWSGDVWKVAAELQVSENKEFAIVNIDRGIGILKPKTNFIYKSIDAIQDQDFDSFYKKYYKNLPIINCNEGLNFISKI